MRRRHASFEYLAGNVRMRADRDLAGRRREHSIKYRQGLPLPPTMPPTTFVATFAIATFASGRPSFAADGRPGTAATMHDLRPTRRCRGTKLKNKQSRPHMHHNIVVNKLEIRRGLWPHGV